MQILAEFLSIGDIHAMAENDDKRGAPKGSQGNVPHQRNAAAAAVITRLASYGVPQSCISDFLGWAQTESLIAELGEQGYSIDTLQRHYRDALDQGRVPSKEMLMGRMYAMAMMENLPAGVSADRAYSVAADKLEKLLNIQHGIVAHQSHRHAGPGGGPIPIALIEATLTAEEIETLAYLTGKLEAAAAEQ
jgi:hypothetical protein